MSITVHERQARQDSTWDVLFAMDGNMERWVGVPDGIAQDAGLLEDYVRTMKAEQPTLPEVG